MKIKLNNPNMGINSDHMVYSNFFEDNYIVQNSAIHHPKNLLIDTLRHYFSFDNTYTYRSDEYGFPLVRDLSGTEPDTELSTEILITDTYRFDARFFPAIIIKNSGGSYKPISFNQNQTTKYRNDIIEDDFGTKKRVSIPTHIVLDGAWDVNFDVSVFSESMVELEELTEIITMILQYRAWRDLRANGLFIKTLNFSGENAEPYANDFVYSHSITINCRSEWRVEIPIENLVERVNFYFESTKTPSIISSGPVSPIKYRFSDLVELTDTN